MREAKPVVFIAPQLATLVAQAPEGDKWLHEIKFDGYRAEILAEHHAKVFTRSGAGFSYPVSRSLACGRQGISFERVTRMTLGAPWYAADEENLQETDLCCHWR